jgi:hypothetical protein
MRPQERSWDEGKQVMQLLVLFVHLVGVCLALGMILLTDARLLARVAGYRVVILPPSRFDTRVITGALLLLTVSGVALIAYGLAARPDYLTNPKLQAKLVLVVALAVNAVVLHRVVFPILERARPVSRWTSTSRWRVAMSVGLSNSLWFYCAFLGIARPWNFTLPFWQVFVVAPALWVVFALTIRFILTLAARDEPSGDGDWIDSMKATLSGLTTTSELGEFQHDFERAAAKPRPSQPARRPRSTITG